MRILFWYTEYKTWGHTANLLSVIRGVKKRARKSEIYVIHEGLMPIPREVTHIADKWIEIPSTIKYPGYLKDIIAHYRPDICVFDFIPFGTPTKIPHLIDSIEHAKKKIKFISIWEAPIFSYPLNKKNYHLVKILCQRIDKFIFTLPEELFSLYLNIYSEKQMDKATLANNMKILSNFKEKFHFCGFILPPDLKVLDKQEIEALRRKMGVKPNNKIVLVSTGGGSIYKKLINESLKLSKISGGEFFFIISSGRTTPEAENKIIKRFIKTAGIKKHTLFEKWFDDFPILIQLCDYYVGTGGSTVFQLLYFKKKAIIAPFNRENFTDHPYEIVRANLLKNLLGSKIIDYKEVGSPMLLNLLNKWGEEKSDLKKIHHSWFKGNIKIPEALLD